MKKLSVGFLLALLVTFTLSASVFLYHADLSGPSGEGRAFVSLDSSTDVMTVVGQFNVVPQTFGYTLRVYGVGDYTGPLVYDRPALFGNSWYLTPGVFDAVHNSIEHTPASFSIKANDNLLLSGFVTSVPEPANAWALAFIALGAFIVYRSLCQFSGTCIRKTTKKST